MKKKIVLTLVFLMILGLLVGAGFFVYSYTDYFKTDKQIFYKYLFDKNEMFSVLEKIKLPSESKSYKANTDINYIYNYDNRIEEMTDDQIIKNLEEQIKNAEQYKTLNANIQSKVDKENKNENHIVSIKKDNENVLKIDCIRSEDAYAMKPEEVLNTYVGIENKNIKELASKFGVTSTGIQIPNKIDYDNSKYNDLFYINDNDKKHIINTYKEVLLGEISESCYIREKEQKVTIDENDYLANKNVLILNREESINLAIKLLEKLKEDNVTLNIIKEKIKIINNEDEYGKTENVVGLIQSYIDELKASPKTHAEFLRIEVYDCKGQTIKLDISIEKKKKLEIDFVGDGDQKTLYIKQNFTQNDSPAIIYDLKTSILGANNITITTGKDLYKVEVILYDLEDTYRRILEEKQNIYNNQNDMATSVLDLENEEDKDDVITEQELKNIKDLYNKYSNMDKKLLRIGFNIEYVKNSVNNEDYTVYANICNTKIGVRCNTKKEYTTELGNMDKLNNQNCIFLNKYSKEQITGVIKLISNRMISKINENNQRD